MNTNATGIIVYCRKPHISIFFGSFGRRFHHSI